MLWSTGLVSAMVNADFLLGGPYSFGKWYSLDLKDLWAGAVVWKEGWSVKLLPWLPFDAHNVHCCLKVSDRNIRCLNESRTRAIIGAYMLHDTWP